MSNIQDTEEWRPVVGYEEKYSVSNIGRVRGERKLRGCRGRILSSWLDKDGYCRVRFKAGGFVREFKVHRLVAAAFIGESPAGHHVNHINFIRSDNRACNLEYVTPSQNLRHSAAAGRQAGRKKRPLTTREK